MSESVAIIHVSIGRSNFASEK